MVELVGRELQLYMYEILKNIDVFAKKNNITYFLSGGTLLGAIRHNGFIPWDDDIDIMMPRKDYEYLVANYKDERYVLSHCYNDPDYDSPYARIWDSYTEIKWATRRMRIGVYVDIFPIDGYPDSIRLSRMRERHIMFNRKRLQIAVENPDNFNGKLKGVKRFVQKYVGTPNSIAKKMDQYASKYPYESANYVGVQIGTHNTYKERNEKSNFEKAVYVQFEDQMFPVPCGYDAYLRKLFGDYMVLPPAEKRVSLHKTPYYLIKED